MRIVVDLQGAQTESRFRGIGRYSLAFAQALARNRRQHEVIIVLNGIFSDTIAPIIDAFAGILPSDHIVVWHAPGPLCAQNDHRESRRVAQLMREAFLANLNPDVIHISSLFEGYLDDAVTSIGLFDTQTPVSVSFYDLIPLLNPQQYLLPNARYEKHYRAQVEALQKARLFLSISEFARTELISTLPIDPGRVINVSTAANPLFSESVVSDGNASQVLNRWGIHRPFLLYTGGADERKNLERLLEAFAGLPKALREDHQLVFAGKIDAWRQWQLEQKMHAVGLSSRDCVFTNYVSDHELQTFYRTAKAFIFPSWHEGFGIPPLEAMCCELPVIASHATSIPEVVGLSEALFDPFDVKAMSKAIERVLCDDAFRGRLIDFAKTQAQLFSWDLTAQRAIAAFEDLATSNEGDSRKPFLKANAWEAIWQRNESIREQLIERIASGSEQAASSSRAPLAQIARDIARNEKTSLDFLRRGALPPDAVWQVEGPFDSSYSLALANREIARSLEREGFTVVLHSSEGPGDFDPNPEFLREHPDLARMHARSVTRDPALPAASVVSRFMYPPRVVDMKAHLNLIHGYAWEESGFPSEWVDNFNDYLQGISVASEFVKKVLIDNGVSIPIAVTRLGVDHLERITPDPHYGLQAKTFRFLHVSSCFPRKGIDVMLSAYGKAFTRHDDVSLIIKTFANPHNNARELLAMHQAASPDYPDVQILEEDISPEALKALYLQCQALLVPSRAEGFGFPMAEAMLSGLAVITTNWGGHVDFCRPENAWLIDFEFELARTHLNIADSVWALPSERHLVTTLKEVYALSPAERQARTRRGRELLLREWSWTASTRLLTNAAKQWLRPTNADPLQIAWLSTWNTRCGIAKYSEYLLNAFSVPVTIFAPHAHEKIRDDAHNVQRCWHLDDADPLDALAQGLNECGANFIVIQFNYGFFNFNALNRLVLAQASLGKQIFMTLHSTTDPSEQPHKPLQALLPALQCCERILVHTVRDLNRLKDLGLIHNVMLFPHGVLEMPSRERDVRCEYKATAHSPIIASYGFFLPHKGLMELIEAFAQLRSTYPNAVLRLVNAEYPIAISAQLIASAKARIKTLGLASAVQMHTAFLSDEESLRLLADADLIVFPYQDTGESSSAAVRHGLATGQAVAVTDLAIFDDVLGATFVLDGFDPSGIASGMTKALKEVAEKSENAQRVAKTAQQWRNSHRYSVLSRRLLGSIVGTFRSKPRVDNR